MKYFLSALQFLTIIPVRIKQVDGKIIAGSLSYFPLVGLLLGLILTGTDRLLLFLGFEQLPINVILIVLLIVLTGGIHLDGLADTADAFLSRKNKEEMLRIMRDSRIGTMGVLSLVGIIFLKIALLSSIDIPMKYASLVSMCVLSRWGLVFSMFLFPYGRTEGKAKDFIRGANLKTFIFSSLTTLLGVVIFLGMRGIWLGLTTAVLVYTIGRFVTSRLDGGITGDTLGFTGELVETILLFIMCIIGKMGTWII